MKIKKFNEGVRDDVKDIILSQYSATGVFKKYEEEIKNDVIDYLDNLLEDEIEVVHQLIKLKMGEITTNEVDLKKLTEIGNKINGELLELVKKYSQSAMSGDGQSIKKIKRKIKEDPYSEEVWEKKRW